MQIDTVSMLAVSMVQNNPMNCFETSEIGHYGTLLKLSWQARTSWHTSLLATGKLSV